MQCPHFTLQAPEMCWQPAYVRLLLPCRLRQVDIRKPRPSRPTRSVRVSTPIRDNGPAAEHGACTAPLADPFSDPGVGHDHLDTRRPTGRRRPHVGGTVLPQKRSLNRDAELSTYTQRPARTSTIRKPVCEPIPPCPRNGRRYVVSVALAPDEPRGACLPGVCPWFRLPTSRRTGTTRTRISRRSHRRRPSGRASPGRSR